MKAAYLCAVLFLAGAVSCDHVVVKSPGLPELVDEGKINIPDWIGDLIAQLPDSIQQINDTLPEIIAVIPAIIDRIKEIIAGLDLPELPSLPEINEAVPGTPVSIEEFPGIVQIEFRTGTLWVQICAGSVLTSLHVLSAARCFSGRTYDPRQRRVRAGTSSRYSGGSVVDVDYAINHPSFDHFSFDGDLTVVRLSSNLILDDTIQQTPIVPEGFNLLAGLPVVLAGWGGTAQGTLRTDRDLYQIGLSVSAWNECAEKWSRLPGTVFDVTPNMICSERPETGGRNAEFRDIGAPVYYDNILVGVTVVGLPFGNQAFPVVATSVAAYTSWIVANAN